MTKIEWSRISEEKLIEKIAKMVLSYDTAEINYGQLTDGRYSLTAEVEGLRPRRFCYDDEKWAHFVESYVHLTKQKEDETQ